MSSMVLDGASPRSRSTDPVTSVDAGRAADLKGSQAAVLYALEACGPLAQHELVEIVPGLDESYKWEPQRIRSACSELEKLGRVEFTGEYRSTPKKHPARVYRAVPTG